MEAFKAWGQTSADLGSPRARGAASRSAIAESSEAMKYENKKPETPPDAVKPPLHTADTLTRGVAIDERGCKARFHGLASEGRWRPIAPRMTPRPMSRSV